LTLLNVTAGLKTNLRLSHDRELIMKTDLKA
jgi:hypothetical protein